MKKFLCVIVALALMLSATALAQTPGNDLGIEILMEMTDGTQNAAVSPASLLFALSMAAEGAQGETRSEMFTALNIEDLADVSALMESMSGAGLRVANAAFSSGDVELLADYAKTLHETYRAEWFSGDDFSADAVNAWVKEKTDGMIDPLFDGELPDGVLLALVNAVAMDAKWEVSFNPESNTTDTFHAPSGGVEVTFMNRESYFGGYLEKDGLQAVKLNYLDHGLSMYVLLAEEGGVPALLETIKTGGLSSLGDFSTGKKVDLALPKFSITSGGSMKDALMKVMPAAFSDMADFSGISDTPLMIDDVIQKVRIDVDEDGTRAAAATIVDMMATSAMLTEEPVSMKVDRPFVAVIADAETGAIAFMAAVVDPAQA